MRPARILTFVIALVACAWFALGIRQAHETGQAAALISGPKHLTTPQARHAEDLLHAASLLNPDTQVDMLRAELDHNIRRYSDARAILHRVLSKEPQNLGAWLLLAGSSSPAEAYGAFIQLHQLEPLRPPAR
jgi:predicted Zn-dependent protease